jgi:hypothetical protein
MLIPAPINERNAPFRCHFYQLSGGALPPIMLAELVGDSTGEIKG